MWRERNRKDPRTRKYKRKTLTSKSTTITNTVDDETGKTNPNSPSSPAPGCSLPTSSAFSTQQGTVLYDFGINLL